MYDCSGGVWGTLEYPLPKSNIGEYAVDQRNLASRSIAKRLKRPDLERVLAQVDLSFSNSMTEA